MKKITKFLDSVMGGIKRTCIAKALAVFAVASIAINANAQSNDLADVQTLDDLPGKTLEEIKENAVADGQFPETDKNKMFFLYNVKTGKFLNVGGYWGTHISLEEYGKPFWAVKKTIREQTGTGIFGSPIYENVEQDAIYFTQNMNTGSGYFLGWFGTAANAESTEDDRYRDIGVFVDRPRVDGSKVLIYGWELEEVTTDTQKNTYRIYTYTSVNSDGSKIRNANKYYLCANNNFTGVDAEKNCEAYSPTVLSKNADIAEGYDEWRILTYQQIYALQEQGIDNMKTSLDLSFKLKAPGFQRGDNDLQTAWSIRDYYRPTSTPEGMMESGWRFGMHNVHTWAHDGSDLAAAPIWNATKGQKFDNDSYTYILDNVEYKKDDSNGLSKKYECSLAKYFCGSATNVRGLVWQDVEVTRPGTYVIECKGFSTTPKAVLFAGVKKDQYSMEDGAIVKKQLSQTSKMSADEKTKMGVTAGRATADGVGVAFNMDCAGIEFEKDNKYTNSVTVKVVFGNSETSKTIRFGILIGEKDDETVPTENEWTVFDDFRLLFASKSTVEDLILDEYRDNLDYLVNTKTTYKNRTLHLKKDLKADCWNSFILPVDLTKEQVRKAFGANTRLAKLSKLTETAIEFESVKMETMENGAQAMEAYVPYIIFPSGSNEGITQPAYTATLALKNGGIKQVKIAENHYTIQNVTVPTDTDGANIWQFNKENGWKVKGNTVNGNGSMEAWGTFARTFGTEQTEYADGTYTYEKNGNIIAGRDDLKGCYFFDNGKMYHSKPATDPTSRARGLRGFSCWFMPVNGESQNASFTLDGVSQGTTGIEDILADYEQPVSRFANGIYNLNGQLVKQGNSTAGLPSGLYIVNGKKCIVR